MDCECPDAVACSRLLLQAGYNPNVQDKDGWSPLHAAAHWGVEEACRLLAEHFCDMEALNNVVSKGGSKSRTRMWVQVLAQPQSFLCDIISQPNLPHRTVVRQKEQRNHVQQPELFKGRVELKYELNKCAHCS